MSYSANLKPKVVDHIHGVTAYTMPTGNWLALFIGDPSSGGSEIAVGGYARQPITWTAAAGSPTESTNSDKQEFPVATANYGAVDYVATFDAVSGGNQVEEGILAASKTINTDDQFIMPIGNLASQLT